MPKRVFTIPKQLFTMTEMRNHDTRSDYQGQAISRWSPFSKCSGIGSKVSVMDFHFSAKEIIGGW